MDVQPYGSVQATSISHPIECNKKLDNYEMTKPKVRTNYHLSGMGAFQVAFSPNNPKVIKFVITSKISNRHNIKCALGR